MVATLKTRRRRVPAEVYYPESDGEPLGETDAHVSLLLELLGTLRRRFKTRPDLYAYGDIMLYYVEGDPRKVVSPDVMVVRGVGKARRRVYKLWEAAPPEVVIEVSSRKTWGDDLHRKLRIYEQIGVLEYYVFDPEYDYLPEPLLAFHRKNGRLEIAKVKNGRIFSPALGLELVDTGETLRFYDPKTGEFVPTADEEAEAHERAAEAYRREAEARQQAEAEVARLKTELEQLRGQRM
jgi:Uma2 family endonuclease